MLTKNRTTKRDFKQIGNKLRDLVNVKIVGNQASRTVSQISSSICDQVMTAAVTPLENKLNLVAGGNKIRTLRYDIYHKVADEVDVLSWLDDIIWEQLCNPLNDQIEYCLRDSIGEYYESKKE